MSADAVLSSNCIDWLLFGWDARVGDPKGADMAQTSAVGHIDDLSEALSLSRVRLHVLVSGFDGGDPDHASVIWAST